MKAQFKEFYEVEKLEELFKASHNKPVVFFKHSMTCPISKNVLREIAEVDSEIWLMVVQDARKVSNAFAEKTGIKHESPQTVVIKDGKPIYNASHYDATASDVESVISEFEAVK
ncbi:MAG: bacillithiol system redox-active protein YtxJ [Pyrinomonadaceae bacterium]|nr:bacillithiol system redox-active protein YtxJ [Pyrinomonadaceae bacterium]